MKTDATKHAEISSMMHGEHDSYLYKYCPSEDSLSGVMVQRITQLMEHRADLGEI